MYPPVGFHFRVDFLGISDQEIDSRFQEVSGLTAELGVEEVQEGGENRFSHRLPSRAQYGNLVLRRGMVRDSELVKWCEQAILNFDFRPATVHVVLLNTEHQPLSAWDFKGAWPVKWSVSDFSAETNAVVVETLELAYSHFTRLQ
jgi:phage tail-like protein